MKKILYYFSAILRNSPTSKIVTKLINMYLDSSETEINIIDRYHTILTHPEYGGLPLWTANFPYAYGRVSLTGFMPYGEFAHKYSTVDQDKIRTLIDLVGDRLPDRETVYRLSEAINEIKMGKHQSKVNKLYEAFPYLK
jgi:hypothetical protein